MRGDLSRAAGEEAPPGGPVPLTLGDSVGAERPPSPSRGARPIWIAEWLGWSWRQLTSMRTALLLLFVLALGAIPGSIVPQSRINPIAVVEFAARHRSLAPWYRRLGLFDVFGSAWFAAIYLLLMVSLVGCIVPRLGRHLRAIRALPPKAPRRLRRLPAHREWEVDQRYRHDLDAREDRVQTAALPRHRGSGRGRALGKRRARTSS